MTSIWQKSRDFWFANFFLEIFQIYRMVWIFPWIFGCFESVLWRFCLNLLLISYSTLLLNGQRWWFASLAMMKSLVQPLIDSVTLDYLKVPKCEIFDPFFYTNKSYMGRWLEDWREKKKFSKATADIRHFVFFYAGWACAKNLPMHAEPALKNCLCRLSLR